MSIQPISIKNNFFYKGEAHWSPKGVCYQPEDEVDPISDNNEAIITELLNPLNPSSFVNLGINAIRVYQVDPTLEHTKVMTMLSNAGIYVLVGGVNKDVNVVTSGPDVFHGRLHQIADAFCQFDNVLGFSIGNEVIFPKRESDGNWTNQGYEIPNKIRTAAKNMRNYMIDKKYRVIPIGVAIRDIPEFTIPAGKAYMCGDASERMDFIGFNLQRWAGGSIEGKIGAYFTFCESLQNSNPVPIILTEFGVNLKTLNPRQYKQVPYLYGYQNVQPASGSSQINMADIVSGGFAFRYEERSNDPGWGLVSRSGDKIDGAGFDDLSAAYKAVTTFKGTPNTIGTKACDPSNPYVKGTDGNSITVTVKNYANVAIVVVQNGVQLANLPAGSQSAPTSASVNVSDKYELLIQQSVTFYSVCKVSANKLKNGVIIKNDVKWGQNTSCNLS